LPYREKKIVSGTNFEVEIFPISLKEKNKSRKTKRKESLPKQKNLNEKNARKHLIRLANTNFTDQDLVVHLTYTDKTLPKTAAEARADVINFIRRVKRYRKKNGLPVLRYLGVTEFCEPDETDKRKKVRMHHHLFMSGMNRDTLEKLWGKGRANADRLQEDEFGYTALANYIAKDPKGSRRWIQSKNIKQPDYKPPNDSKYSKRRVIDLAHNCDDRELFEREYPGYRFLDCEVKVNKETDAIYLYIRMKAKGAIPKRE
jgi:hypothetical protein